MNGCGHFTPTSSSTGCAVSHLHYPQPDVARLQLQVTATTSANSNLKSNNQTPKRYKRLNKVINKCFKYNSKEYTKILNNLLEVINKIKKLKNFSEIMIFLEYK